jgi:pilus assembly protein CpaB
MNKNILVVMGGGLLMAVIVGVMVNAGLSGNKTSSTQILVSIKSLKVGVELTPADVKWQNWPADSVSGAMIVRKDSKQPVADVAKGQLRRDLGAGEPVLNSFLVSGGKGNILSAALTPGMRAVAIKVKAESMVGGFISPGDRVDVIMTYEVKTDKDNPEVQRKIQKYASETILENVKILAIDQQARKDDDKAKVGRTVTLEVDAGGAEKLNLASTMAEEGLTLSLRGIGDESISDRKQVTTDTEISTVLQELNRPISAAPVNAPLMLRVYNGEKVQTVPIGSMPTSGEGQ